MKLDELGNLSLGALLLHSLFAILESRNIVPKLKVCHPELLAVLLRLYSCLGHSFHVVSHKFVLGHTLVLGNMVTVCKLRSPRLAHSIFLFLHTPPFRLYGTKLFIISSHIVGLIMSEVEVHLSRIVLLRGLRFLFDVLDVTKIAVPIV